MSVEAVEQAIGYRFSNRELLGTALVHRSSLTGGGVNNEKFEFLGDAVLQLAVSDLLMERTPEADEGELSKRRAALVNAKVLAAKATELALGAALRLGKGEEKSGGRRKASILAAAYEAVVGAVYLDGGFSVARDLVARHFAADLDAPRPIDPKSRLQELTQKRFHETPGYSLVRTTGPDHDKAFVAEITIAGRLYGRGEGKSKKEAEQQAALVALAELDGPEAG